MAMTAPWNVPEVQTWQRSAIASQTANQKIFGEREYDVFQSTASDLEQLRRRIALVMCETPESADGKLSQSLCRREEKRLEKIFNLVSQHNANQTLFRVSFFCIDCFSRKGRFFYSVIRLHLPYGKSVFFDNVPRSYNGFDDFLENNRLPKCLMCYPVSASYYCRKGEMRAIQFRKSPECNIAKKVLLGTDIAAIAVGVVAVPIGIGAIFFPPLAVPAVTVGTWITGGALTTYSLARSVERLVNRHEHGQTLGLQSPEARNCWLAIGGAAAFFTSVGAIIAVRQAIVSGAEVTSMIARVPTVLSLSASGLGVASIFSTIVMKLIQGERVDATDWFYLISSIFLVANVVVTAYQAKVIVTELVDSGVKLENILTELDISVKAKTTVELNTLVHPNAVVYLAPFKIFYTITSPEANMSSKFQYICKLVSAAAKKITSTFLNAGKCLVKIFSLLWEFWTTFGNEMQSVVDWFSKIRGMSGLRGVFDCLTSAEALEVGSSLLTMGTWLRNQGVADNERIPLADALALQEQAGTVSPDDGAKEWTEEIKLTFELLKKEFERQKTIYQERYKCAKRYSPNLSENEFQEEEGITGPLKEFLWKKALSHIQKDFHSENSLLKLSKGRLNPSPESSGLVDPETGMTVYFYHGVTPTESDQQLSSEQYFSLVREKVGSALVQGSKLEVDRESRVAFFRDLPSNAEGASCVIVQSVPEDGVVAGHIYVVKGD